MRVQEVCELLDIRMVEIRQRWQEGRLQAIGLRRVCVGGGGGVGWLWLCLGPGGSRFPKNGKPTFQLLLTRPPPPPPRLRPVLPPACSAGEVAHLVAALFEDTDLRRDFLQLLEQQQQLEEEGNGLL